MEVLKFYSWAPNPRYNSWVKQMKDELSQMSIVARHSGAVESTVYSHEDWPYLEARAITA
jgi:hypothetical protein